MSIFYKYLKSMNENTFLYFNSNNQYTVKDILNMIEEKKSKILNDFGNISCIVLIVDNNVESISTFLACLELNICPILLSYKKVLKETELKEEVDDFKNIDFILLDSLNEQKYQCSSSNIMKNINYIQYVKLCRIISNYYDPTIFLPKADAYICSSGSLSGKSKLCSVNFEKWIEWYLYNSLSEEKIDNFRRFKNNYDLQIPSLVTGLSKRNVSKSNATIIRAFLENIMENEDYPPLAEYVMTNQLLDDDDFLLSYTDISCVSGIDYNLIFPLIFGKAAYLVNCESKKNYDRSGLIYDMLVIGSSSILPLDFNTLNIPNQNLQTSHGTSLFVGGSGVSTTKLKILEDYDTTFTYIYGLSESNGMLCSRFCNSTVNNYGIFDIISLIKYKLNLEELNYISDCIDKEFISILGVFNGAKVNVFTSTPTEYKAHSGEYTMFSTAITREHNIFKSMKYNNEIVNNYMDKNIQAFSDIVENVKSNIFENIPPMIGRYSKEHKNRIEIKEDGIGEILIDGYTTGDLGFIYRNRIYFLGRKNDMYINPKDNQTINLFLLELLLQNIFLSPNIYLKNVEGILSIYVLAKESIDYNIVSSLMSKFNLDYNIVEIDDLEQLKNNFSDSLGKFIKVKKGY